jgi:tetratricopeptide (TPR) repeat protein
MKKWIICILTILIVGITAIVYRGRTMSFEDYLDLAETSHERKAYDQEMVNLEKALEISLEDNGELSLVTADIYRRMGECVRDTDQIAGNFDKAIAIYEKCGGKDVAGLYYEKGKRLMERGTGSSVSLGKESLERAISMYERDGYEDSDKLCGSYLILADAEMDEWKKWRYLEKAESCFGDLSKEGQWEMGNWGYRQMGVTWFRKWDYEKAFEYFDAMLSRAEESEEEDAEQVIAEAQYMSGAALVLTDRAEEGKERIEKAVLFYDAYDRSVFYRNAAMAHAFLAVAYGMLEPENEQKALGQGELALSYFTQLEAVNSEDVRFIGYIQSILLQAYKGVYP